LLAIFCVENLVKLWYNVKVNKQYLEAVLWDISKERVDSLPVDFVIRRVLSYGGLFLIIKTMHAYGIDTVKRVFEAMKPTSISERKYFYLKNFLLA